MLIYSSALNFLSNWIMFLSLLSVATKKKQVLFNIIVIKKTDIKNLFLMRWVYFDFLNSDPIYFSKAFQPGSYFEFYKLLNKKTSMKS